MMQDKLKDFIDNNRDEFDSNEPPPRLFEHINKQLKENSHTKKIFSTPFRFAVAAVLAVLLTGSLYLILKKKESTNSMSEINNRAVDEADIIGDPVYAKQIDNFREVIGLQQSALKQLEKEYPELYKQFVGDIIVLDSAYQSLKINLTTNPNREMLLEAMIQNLQLQNDLLNKQLLIIKEIKQKNNNHEKNPV